MPKPFVIIIECEELAAGKVMRQLNNMPGVAKVTMDLERERKPGKSNGEFTHAEHRKPSVRLEQTGEESAIDFMWKKKRPVTSLELRDHFESEGRSPNSTNSVCHTLTKRGDAKSTDDGWMLTRKTKDRLRHRGNK